MPRSLIGAPRAARRCRRRPRRRPGHPRQPDRSRLPVALIPQNGPAGGAGTSLVIPGVRWMQAVRPSRRLGRLGRGLVGLRQRWLRGLSRSGWRAAWRGNRPGFGRGGVARVVPQGRPDDLPAPLDAGPLGELRPRQYLVYPRHVILGDRDPEHDGDAGSIRQPGSRHGSKVPRTGSLERGRPTARSLASHRHGTPADDGQAGAGQVLSYASTALVRPPPRDLPAACARGYGAAGSASAWHAEGQGFESP